MRLEWTHNAKQFVLCYYETISKDASPSVYYSGLFGGRVGRFHLLVLMVSLSLGLNTTLFLFVLLNYLILSTCLTNSEKKLPPTAASSKDVIKPGFQCADTLSRERVIYPHRAFPVVLRNK